MADTAVSELACVYAALILHDDDVAVTAEKLSTVMKAANVDFEPFWPSLFAKALEGRNIGDLICNVGAAPAAGGAPAAAGGGAAEEAKEEEKGCEWQRKRGGSEDWKRARQDVQALDDRMVAEAPYYGWVYGMHEDGHLLVYRPESRSSFRVDTFGKTLRKPWVAVVALRGRVYAIPYNADKLLVYDPAIGQVSGIDTSRVDKGDGKWKGAVVLGTKVYAVPWNAKKILMYDPETGKVRGTDTSKVHGTEGKKWWGAVAMGDKLYAVPFNAEGGLIYDSLSDKVSTFKTFSVETGSGKWAGAVAYGGKVYGVPFNAQRLLEFSPFSQSASSVKGIDISEVEKTTFFGKWTGAVVVDGDLYAVPYNAKNLLKYKLSGEETTGLDSSSAGSWVHRQWTGVVAMNGRIVAVPETGKVLTYHPESQQMQDQEVTGVGDGWTAAVALTGSVPPLACES